MYQTSIIRTPNLIITEVEDGILFYLRGKLNSMVTNDLGFKVEEMLKKDKENGKNIYLDISAADYLLCKPSRIKGMFIIFKDMMRNRAGYIKLFINEKQKPFFISLDEKDFEVKIVQDKGSFIQEKKIAKKSLIGSEDKRLFLYMIPLILVLFSYTGLLIYSLFLCKKWYLSLVLSIGSFLVLIEAFIILKDIFKKTELFSRIMINISILQKFVLSDKRKIGLE